MELKKVAELNTSLEEFNSTLDQAEEKIINLQGRSLITHVVYRKDELLNPFYFKGTDWVHT